jgi:hypothetical protein
MAYEEFHTNGAVALMPLRSGIIMITEIIIIVIIFMRHQAAALAGSSSGPGGDGPGPADVPTTAGVRTRLLSTFRWLFPCRHHSV